MGNVHIHINTEGSGSIGSMGKKKSPPNSRAQLKSASGAATSGKMAAKPRQQAGNAKSSGSSSSAGLSSSSLSSSSKPKTSSSPSSGNATNKKTLGMQQQQTPTGSPKMGPLLGTTQGQSMPGAGQMPSAPSPNGVGDPATQKPPVPQKPIKEPSAPPDVSQARKQQSQVLQMRQQRETKGKKPLNGSPRDTNAGSGFWPPLSPLL